MPVSLNPVLLDKVLLLRDLTATEIERLSTFLHRTTVPPRTVLMSAEQPGEVAYIILTGTVKVHTVQANGSEVILSLLGVGEVVGELSLIDNTTRSANVITLEESTLLWIDRAALNNCLREMPSLALNLVRILARRVRMANAQIQSLATQDVLGRVARLVLAFADEYGETTPAGDIVIPLGLTQSDLASLVGASRVRVNQAISFFKQRNVFSVNQQHHITLHKPAVLAQRCL